MGESILCTKIVLNVRNNFCTQHVLPRFELGIFMYLTCNSMNNLSSYCGLVDAKIRASEKDLPVLLAPLPILKPSALILCLVALELSLPVSVQFVCIFAVTKDKFGSF